MNFLLAKITLPYSNHLQFFLREPSTKLRMVIGILTVIGGVISAQALDLISNGSFKDGASLFSTSPGTFGVGSNPENIPSWNTYPDHTSKGINGALSGVGNIFGPNDDGDRTYAYVQHNDSGMYQYINMLPNTTYVVGLDVAGRDGNSGAAFSIQFSKPGEELTPFYNSGTIFASTDQFTHYSVQFTTPADLTGPSTIQLWNRSPAGDYSVVFASISVAIPKENGLSFKAPLKMTAVVNKATISPNTNRAIPQILVLADSFDTGGLATNALNYNQASRQSGSAAPSRLSATTKEFSLSSGGELMLAGEGTVRTGILSPQIEGQAFNIKVTGRSNTPEDGGSTMLSVVSDIDNDFNKSPITVVLYAPGWLGLRHGIGGDTTETILSPDEIKETLGAACNLADNHAFEIQISAQSATTGVWSFIIDGTVLASRLPYEFSDPNLKMSWWADGADVQSTWNNLDISLNP